MANSELTELMIPADGMPKEEVHALLDLLLLRWIRKNVCEKEIPSWQRVITDVVTEVCCACSKLDPKTPRRECVKVLDEVRGYMRAGPLLLCWDHFIEMTRVLKKDGAFASGSRHYREQTRNCDEEANDSY